MKVLEVKNLEKRLGKRKIIDGVSFDVEAGEIFGFLGPNGAGKTTTIRMLVGLIHPNAGDILIGGKNLKKEREEALSSVGAVVENPELYKYLSGRENLMQIARIRKVPKSEIEELIRLVGLEERIDDKVKKYSLGMKQRLGVAAALIGNPKLLILDEPTNGLDPSGILDFREIVKKAAREKGIAVFVSSHILSEVQQLCDRVAFINKGVIQSVENIKDNTMETDSICIQLVIKSGNLENLHNEIDYISTMEKNEKGYKIILNSDSISRLIIELVSRGVEVEEVYKLREGLEQRYMELVEGGLR